MSLNQPQLPLQPPPPHARDLSSSNVSDFFLNSNCSHKDLFLTVQYLICPLPYWPVNIPWLHYNPSASHFFIFTILLTLHSLPHLFGGTGAAMPPYLSSIVHLMYNSSSEKPLCHRYATYLLTVGCI